MSRKNRQKSLLEQLDSGSQAVDETDKVESAEDSESDSDAGESEDKSETEDSDEQTGESGDDMDAGESEDNGYSEFFELAVSTHSETSAAPVELQSGADESEDNPPPEVEPQSKSENDPPSEILDEQPPALVVRATGDFSCSINGSLRKFKAGEIIGDFITARELIQTNCPVVVAGSGDYSQCPSCKHIYQR